MARNSPAAVGRCVAPAPTRYNRIALIYDTFVSDVELPESVQIVVVPGIVRIAR